MTTHDEIVSISPSGITSEIAYPTGVSTSTSHAKHKQIAVDSNLDIHLLAYHDSATRLYTWIYDTSLRELGIHHLLDQDLYMMLGTGRTSFTLILVTSHILHS